MKVRLIKQLNCAIKCLIPAFCFAVSVALLLPVALAADSDGFEQRVWLSQREAERPNALFPKPSHNKPKQKRNRLSMNEAIEMAKRRSNGEVLSATRRVNRQGELVYHIKVLSGNGVVRTIRINAG